MSAAEPPGQPGPRPLLRRLALAGVAALGLGLCRSGGSLGGPPPPTLLTLSTLSDPPARLSHRPVRQPTAASTGNPGRSHRTPHTWPPHTSRLQSGAWFADIGVEPVAQSGGTVRVVAGPLLQTGLSLSVLGWAGAATLGLSLGLLLAWRHRGFRHHGCSGRQHHDDPTVWVALAVVPSDQSRDPPLRVLSADVQRLLEQYCIDVAKVVQRHPPVAAYDVARVGRVTAYLAGLGADVRRVVEVQPSLLGRRMDVMQAIVELLQANGVSVAKVVTQQPSVLTRQPATLRRSMEAIAACNHSAAEVINRRPSVLRFGKATISSMLQLQQPAEEVDEGLAEQPVPFTTSTEAVDPRVTLLASLGLDAYRLLRKDPRVLWLNPHKIQVVLEYLRDLGVDVTRVVRNDPSLLATPLEQLQRRVTFLRDSGLDAVRHINGAPVVLRLSVEGKLRPMLAFFLEEMGFSLTQLDRAPNLWTYSLENRLRPRLRYLRSLGISSVPTSFGHFSDERFASRLADTDLRHYTDWRRQHGYPVPPADPSATVAPAATAPVPPALSSAAGHSDSIVPP